MVQRLLETGGGVPGQQHLELTNGEADRRKALVERVFSFLHPDLLGGLSIDALITYADRMHATLMGLSQPMDQRLSDVFLAIEGEFDKDKRKALNTALPELGNASPWEILVRIAHGQENFSLTSEHDSAD